MELSAVGRLKAEIRLAQAVSQFEADLTSEQKVDFRTQRSITRTRAPDINDVMHLTASIDRNAASSSSHLGVGARCVGPRLTNFLQSVQQYVALGDVVVGGAQNLVASGVWALVRFSFLSLANHASYLEKLSMLFMHAGRSAPRYQQLALLYPHSKTLQVNLNEYFVTVVHVCHNVLRFSRKSFFGQFTATMSDDAVLKQYQNDLDTWASAIREEVTLLMSRTIEGEAAENSGFRAVMSSFSVSAAHRMATKDRLAVLDACSMFDHQTPWKQARKIGNTTLFLHSDAYSKWKSDPGASTRTLVCTGILGSGKSVMMANMVDDLNIHAQAHKAPVAYFFCRHDIPESLRQRTILGSLLRQLLSTISTLLPLPASWEMNPKVDIDDLLEYFYNAPKSWLSAYLVLDGLDECTDNDRRMLLSYFRTLQERLNIRICFSLRLEADDSFHDHISSLLSPTYLTIPKDNPDIANFISSELDLRIKAGGFRVGDPRIYQEIRDALLKGAQGMFLWVSLQITSLCAERTDERIRAALRNLPTTLSETFSRILATAASGDDKETYQRLIMELVAVAVRPLTAEELREALSVTPEDTRWSAAKLINNVQAVLACCGSLIIADEEEATIRLIHHSVKQFLFGRLGAGFDTGLTVEDANRRMGRIILTYLSYDRFDTLLSKMVFPDISIEAAPQKVVKTIDIKAPRAMALKFLKSRAKPASVRAPSYNLGQALVNHGNYYRAMTAHDTFLGYARAFWLAHTGSIGEEDLFSRRVLFKFFEQNDVLEPPNFSLNQDMSSSSWMPSGQRRPTDSPYLTKLLATPSFSRIKLSLQIPHTLLLRHEMRLGLSIQKIANIVIALRMLASSSEPPPWDKNMCNQLLPFAAVSRSVSIIRHLRSRGGSSLPIHMNLLAEAIVKDDRQLLGEIVVTESSIFSTSTNFFNSDPLSHVNRFGIDTRLITYLVSLEHPSHLLYFLDGIYTLGQAEFIETALARASAGIPLNFDRGARHAKRLLVDCLAAIPVYPGDKELPRIIMALFSREQRNQILFDCCSLNRVNDHALISLALEAGVDAHYFDPTSRMTSVSRLIRSANLDMATLEAVLKTLSIPLSNFVDRDTLAYCLDRRMIDVLRCLVRHGLGTDILQNMYAERGLLHNLIHSVHMTLASLEANLESLSTYPNYFLEQDVLIYCLEHKMNEVLNCLVRHGLDRSILQDVCAEQGLLHQRIREGDGKQVKFMCDRLGIDMNCRQPSSDWPATPLLTAIAFSFEYLDPFDMVMQIVVRGADLNDCGSVIHNLTAIDAVLHLASKHGLQSKLGAAFVRLARTFITYRGKFGFDQTQRLLNQLLREMVVRTRVGSSLVDECILDLVELLRQMLLQKPPSASDLRHFVHEVDMALKEISERQALDSPHGDNVQHTSSFLQHILLDILSILLSSVLRWSREADVSRMLNISYPGKSSNRPEAGMPVLPHEDVTELRTRIAALIINYLCPPTRQNGVPGFDWSLGQNRAAEKAVDLTEWFYFPFEMVLNSDPRFLDDISRQLSNMPTRDRDTLILRVIDVAVAKGDVASTRVACRFFLGKRPTPTAGDIIRAAETVRDRLNQCAQPGQCYELEADVPISYLRS